MYSVGRRLVAPCGAFAYTRTCVSDARGSLPAQRVDVRVRLSVPFSLFPSPEIVHLLNFYLLLVLISESLSLSLSLSLATVYGIPCLMRHEYPCVINTLKQQLYTRFTTIKFN